MKKATDPRHQYRIKIVEELFSDIFLQNQRKNPRTNEIINNYAFIDKAIAEAAPEWPIDKISRIDLAILRLAVYELLIDKKEPLKVIIDEAVEIAKTFGNDKSPSFINGVLGTIINTTKNG